MFIGHLATMLINLVAALSLVAVYRVFGIDKPAEQMRAYRKSCLLPPWGANPAIWLRYGALGSAAHLGAFCA